MTDTATAPTFIEPELSKRGYLRLDTAVREAVKVAGWTAKGGSYFRPVAGSRSAYGYQHFAYTGVKHAENVAAHALRNGWVQVQSTGRWTVTPEVVAYARRWFERDAWIASALMEIPDERRRTAFDNGEVAR